MGVLKEPDYKRLLSAPDDSIPVILIHGPDTGLVSERFAELMSAYGRLSGDDPFAKITLDAAEIDRESDRIVNEALTISMFGGKRLIGLRVAGSKTIDTQIQALLDQDTSQSVVIIAAGDLKKTQALRKRIESHRRSASLPCYVDAVRDVDRIIDEEAASANLQVSKEARNLLHTILGADRLATRQELQKLCLYCADKSEIDVSDVEEIVADAASLALDVLIDAVAGGQTARAGREFDRLTASGQHPSMIASQALRHMQNLDLAISAKAAGRSTDDALAAIRPPIFFKRKETVKRQVGIWDAKRVARATNVLYDAIEQGRKNSRLESSIVSNALLSVARVAHALGRRR